MVKEIALFFAPVLITSNIFNSSITTAMPTFCALAMQVSNLVSFLLGRNNLNVYHSGPGREKVA
jgi:hypothetical protein